MLAWTVGECREGQYPVACSGVIDLSEEEAQNQVDAYFEIVEEYGK